MMSANLSYAKSEETARMLNSDLRTVPDYLYFHSKNKPNQEAIVFACTDGSRESVTFQNLYEKSIDVAKRLIKLGVRKSEVVAVSMRTSSKWMYTFLGAVLAGARPIALSFTYSDGSDVIAMMEKLQTCSLIVLDPGAEEENWNIFKKVVEYYDSTGKVKSKKMPYLRYLICHARPKYDFDVLTLEELLTWEITETLLPNILPEDIFALFQTSGSTGAPKAVAHTNKSFINVVRTFSEAQLYRTDEILFNNRPFTWLGGFPLNVVNGQTRVTTSGYCEQPDDKIGFLVDVIKREKCYTLLALPTLLNGFLLRQNELGNDWPVKAVLTGGQPISKMFGSCIGKVCNTFINAYGSTEYFLGIIHAVQSTEQFHDYSIGRPLQGVEVKIVNENEEIVSIGERGEIFIKTDSLFKGYYNDPEKTKAVMTEDGWYRTDDIGVMNEDGIIYCFGRKSEMIISGGMNVDPSILEAVLQNCPGVTRAVCVPVPHKVIYQVVCACVILEAGSDLKETGIRSYCKQIHNDKPGLFTVLPTYYMFLEEFPQTYTGKVSRKELTKLAKGLFLNS